MSCKARILFLSIGFLWIAVDHIHSTRTHRSGFDQPCNKTLRCKSQSWFACDQDTVKCRCAKSDEMVYDPIKEKCISLIGERCKFGFDDDDGNEALYERAECVEGAECGPSGTCSCQDGHYEDEENNQCLPVKDKGQPCGSKYECNQGKHLNCILGNCQCDPDSAYNQETFNYHDRNYGQIFVPSNICIGRIGTKCQTYRSEPHTYCVKGAECGPFGYCSCQDGYYEDAENNQCLPVKDYHQLCLNKNECNQEKLLSCVNGQCKCDPDNAVYNTKTFDQYFENYGTISVPSWNCVGRVGTRCSYDSSERRKYCVDNSICDFSGICSCSGEYSQTSDRLCGLGYDQPCSEINICSDKLQCLGFQEVWNSDAWVHKMTCQCPHPKYQSYDTTLKICRGTVGAPCVPNDRLSCVDKASCIERDNIFQCECDEEFIETLTGGCQIAHGASCDYTQVDTPTPQTNFCDSFADLKCKDGICSCGNGVDVYESDRRKCLSPVGIRCDDTAECISNSECVKLPITNNFPGRCTCKEGFIVTNNHTCIFKNN